MSLSTVKDGGNKNTAQASSLLADAEKQLEIYRRVLGYTRDRLGAAAPASGVALGTSCVFAIAALEGRLQLQTPSPSERWLDPVRIRFIARYASYNVLPSLICGTVSPKEIVDSSNYLSAASNLKYHPTEKSLPARRAVHVKLLASLRGALAGTVVLSQVLALTSLYLQGQQDYLTNVCMGREPPLTSTSKSNARGGPSKDVEPEGTVIRLAGARSNVTDLSWKRKGICSLWPIFEVAPQTRDKAGSALDIPFYWHVEYGTYSQQSSWEGMVIPKQWLFSIKDPDTKLLYLEADATSGDENALALQSGQYFLDERDGRGVGQKASSELDLVLKEVGQGFRRLTELAQIDDPQLKVCRVLLVDPSMIAQSGGGVQYTLGGLVKVTGLADIVIDARACVLHSMLKWLSERVSSDNSKKLVALDTHSRAWFLSIQAELAKYGYTVIDPRDKKVPFACRQLSPLLVYERSSADTVETVKSVVRSGLVKDASQICGLFPLHDGLEEMDALMSALPTGSGKVGCVCASDIHYRAFEWVRNQVLQGNSPSDIQNQLDSGKAWGEIAP